MFPIININGQPYTRGYRYGSQAAAQIRHSIASYARLFAYRCGLDWAAIQQAALAYLPVLDTHAPELLEEMQGVAAGSQRTLAEIVALNARTELLAGAPSAPAHPEYAAAAAHNQAQGVPDHGECTMVGAFSGATACGTALLAQTWDWQGDQRAACVVLRVQSPGHPDMITLTEAGMLAKIGLNRAGLGVCLNILRSQADGQVPGMPVHLLLRQVLQTGSVSEAMQLVRQAQVAASSCLSIADAAGQAVSLEVTPGDIGVIEPQDALLVHTNHCVTTTAQAGECESDPASSSIPRYERASELLLQQRGQIDRQGIMALLRDRQGAPNSICRRPDLDLPPAERTESVAGIVMDLSERTMWIAPDVPCDVDFIPLSLDA